MWGKSFKVLLFKDFLRFYRTKDTAKVFAGAEWDGLADCAEGLPIQWGMLRCTAGVGSPAWFAGLCFICSAGVDVVMGCRYAAVGVGVDCAVRFWLGESS